MSSADVGELASLGGSVAASRAIEAEADAGFIADDLDLDEGECHVEVVGGHATINYSSSLIEVTELATRAAYLLPRLEEVVVVSRSAA